jgi:serine/threonine-protein kinase
MIKLLKNRYEITGHLGKGGMGSVYKVADRHRRGKVLAVKELRTANQAPGKAAESLTLFQTEALILSRLTHPNLPKVTDYFSLGGSHYIVMEYVEGRKLEE